MTNQPYSPDPQASDYTTARSEDDTVQINNVGDGSQENGHAEKQRSTYVNPAGQEVERQVETYEDKNLQRANMRYWVTAGVYFVLGVLEAIMGLRFLFRLLAVKKRSSASC